MKKRLLVSSALMLVLTSVAATSSTFAWFSVNRKGTVTSPEMIATAKDGGLDIASTPNGVTNLYDVSSKDGKTFYKPVLGPASTEKNPSFLSCPVVYDGIELNSNSNYFMELRISFTSSSTLGVYLSKDTTISIKDLSDEDADAKSTAALNSLRIAFLPANASYVVTGNPLLVYAPMQETGIKYVKNDVVSNGALTETLYDDETELGNSGYVQNGKIDADDITTNDLANKYYMGQVANGAPLYIVARMWLEGTDKDCTNSAIGGIVSALLSFYGVE